MTSVKKQELLTLDLSPMGTLNIILRDKTRLLISKLEKDGHIKHLKNLKHLGVISLSHPSVKHTRWEYVCLMMYITQKVWNSTLLTGLNSTVKSLNISGEEFLQCCIILSDIGHLPGTISSEKGVLKFLLENENERNTFLSNLTDSEYSDLITSCFSHYDFYKLKYLITLNYLHSRNYLEFIQIFKTFISNNIEHDTPQIGKLKKLYFRIRQLSFLYLDSLGSCFPVSLEIQRILFNIEGNEEFFNPNSNTFDSLLEHFENTLTKKLYISPQSSSIHSRNTRFVHQYLNKYRSKVDFKHFLDSYLKNTKSHKEFSVDSDFIEFVFQPYFSIYDIYDLRKFLPYNFKSNLVNLISKERDINKILNKGLSTKSNDFCILNDFRKNIVFLNFILRKFDFKTPNDYVRLLHNLNQCLLISIDCFKFKEEREHNIEDYVNHLILKSVVRKYLQFIIEFLVKDTFYLSNGDEVITYVKFDYRRIFQNKKLPVSETTFMYGKSQILSRYDVIIKNLEEYPEIQNNLKIVRTIISKHTKFKNNLYMFCCNLPIEVEEKRFKPELLKKTSFPEERSSITDIDCVLLLINKGGYELYLIEGKDTQKGIESKVKKDFLKIKNLFQFTDIFSEPIILKGSVDGNGGFILLKNKNRFV